MVEILLDRADSGSVANIIVGDTLVVRVQDGPAERRWVLEDSGSLTFHSAEPVVEKDALPGQRLLRFRAVALGATRLRLISGGDEPAPERLEFVVEVHGPQPSSARLLLRKRT